MALTSKWVKFLDGQGTLRKLLVKLSGESPTEAASNTLVMPTHAVAEITPGTDATHLGKAEDAAHASGDVGVMALAVRTDAPADKSGANGDYEPLQISGGRAWISGGPRTVVSASPTVDTAIYAAGDLIGGKLTFANAARVASGNGEIFSVLLADQAKQSIAIDLILFDSDPTGTTFTDQAALDIADADLTKIICVVPITTYAALNDNSIGFASVRFPFALASGTSLYGCLVSRGTPTFAAGADVTVRLGILQG